MSQEDCREGNSAAYTLLHSEKQCVRGRSSLPLLLLSIFLKRSWHFFPSLCLQKCFRFCPLAQMLRGVAHQAHWLNPLVVINSLCCCCRKAELAAPPRSLQPCMLHPPPLACNAWWCMLLRRFLPAPVVQAGRAPWRASRRAGPAVPRLAPLFFSSSWLQLPPACCTSLTPSCKQQVAERLRGGGGEVGACAPPGVPSTVEEERGENMRAKLRLLRG